MRFRVPVVLGLAYFVAFLPLLAKSPQSGDAAELVMTALHHGLIHPPGFPLQSWLDRLFVALPLGSSAAFRLSLLSHLAQSASIALLAETAIRLGCSNWAALFAVLSYAFYLPILREGIQPEVFALTDLLMILMYFLLAREADLAKKREGAGPSVASVRPGLGPGLGMAMALPFAQHPIAVCALPAIAATLALARPARWPWLAAFVGTLLLLNLSLFGLQGDGSWPGWGQLSTLSEWLRHITRADFGVFNLHPTRRGFWVGGAATFARAISRDYGYLALAPFFAAGVVALSRRARGRPWDAAVAIGILGSLLAGLALILRCGLFVDEDNALVRQAAGVVLERFHSPAMIPASLCVALGVEASASLLARRGRWFRWAQGALLIAFLATVAPASVMAARPDGTAEVYREAAGAEIPANAILIGADDWDIFYGIAGIGGDPSHVRFPIAPKLLGLRWYIRDALPGIDPRLTLRGGSPPDPSALVQSALGRGIPVASVEPRFLSAAPGKLELRGLAYVLSPPATAGRNRTLESAARLCPYIDRLEGIPAFGHEFTRILRARFVRAYEQAAATAHSAGDETSSAAATTVARALEIGDKEKWVAACRLLTSATSIAAPGKADSGSGSNDKNRDAERPSSTPLPLPPRR